MGKPTKRSAAALLFFGITAQEEKSLAFPVLPCYTTKYLCHGAQKMP